MNESFSYSESSQFTCSNEAIGKRPKVLLIAEAANPDWTSVPLIGWSLGQALRTVADVHLVTQVRNEAAIKKTGATNLAEYSFINSEVVAMPLHYIGEIVRGGKNKAWTVSTAVNTLAYYLFEQLVWQRFGKAIQNRQFDLVHRITPLSPTTPSLLAKKCHKANIPFLLGPLNGGVPWPREFQEARHEEREWLSYVRSAYKLLPGYHSTLRYSSAIICGSKYTYGEIPKSFEKKLVYLPENGIDPSRFSLRAPAASGLPMQVCFAGRLVPYKGPDMLIEAAAPLIRQGGMKLDILGDGPLMQKLRQQVEQLCISNDVKLHGWIEHRQIQEVMTKSQVFAFPSVREFGGGAVLEAMALGLVPVVVDYAGPAELVTEDTGFKIPLGTRDQIVCKLRSKLEYLTAHSNLISSMSKNARDRAFADFTWEAKALQIRQIYDWVLGLSKNRPEFHFLQ